MRAKRQRGRDVWRCAALCIAVGICPGIAAAQLEGNLDRFAAGESVADDFHLSRPTTLGHLVPSARLTFDYANAPLVVRTGGTPDELTVVTDHGVAALGLALGLSDRATVFVGLPVSLVLAGEAQATLEPLGVRAPQGAGLGDLALGGRFRLFGEDSDSIALALQGTVTFPSAGVPENAAYRGDRSVSGHPEVLVALRPWSWARVVANVGVRFRDQSEGPGGASFGHELTYGLGVAGTAVRFGTHDASRVDVLLQGYGTGTLSRFGRSDGQAIEGLLGVKLFHESGLTVGAAGGLGLSAGVGASRFRVVGMVGWSPQQSALPEEADSPSPRPEPSDPLPEPRWEASSAPLDPPVELPPAEVAVPDEDIAQDLLASGSTTLAERAFFRINEVIILRRSLAALRAVADMLQSHPEITRLRIVGHADAQGPESFNQRLSEARAEAVKNVLVQAGVAPGRLEAVGVGSTEPAEADARTPLEHARNRRVELTVLARD